MKFQNMSDRQIVFRHRDERPCQCSGQSKEIKMLCCSRVGGSCVQSDRTTMLLLNQANVNRRSSIRNSWSRRFLWAKYRSKMCCNLTSNTKKLFVKCSIRQSVFSKLEVKCHVREIFNLLSC